MSDIIIKNLKDKFEIFDNIIDSLSSVLKKYGENTNRYDCPYYYTERSNIGVLSSAALMTNSWISIEEFGVTRRRSGLGRCDLYLKPIDENNNDHEGFVIEAKKVETKSPNRINEKLLEACEQVKKISKRNAGGSTRVGVVFVVPPIKKDSVSQKHSYLKGMFIEDYINKMIEKMEHSEADFSAHLYLDCFRYLTGTGIYGKNYYPGLSIFGRSL